MKVSIFTIITRAISQSLKSLLRDKWTNLATFLALTLIFLLVHIMSAIAYFANIVVENLEKKVDIGVFIKEEAVQIEINEFINALEREKGSGMVKSYTIFPREKALEEFEKKYPGRMIFLRRYSLDNPLLSMIEILPSEKKVDDLIDFLNDPKFTNTIDQEFLRKNQDDKNRMKNFMFVANFTEKAGGIIYVFFLLCSTALIFYAINNAARKHAREIFIMRLVGARFWHIRSSFLIEGFLLTLSAFVMSLFLTSVLFYIFSISIRNLFLDSDISEAISSHFNQMLSVFSSSLVYNGLFILILAIVASFFAVEKHLRNKDILQKAS